MLTGSCEGTIEMVFESSSHLYYKNKPSYTTLESGSPWGRIKTHSSN